MSVSVENDRLDRIEQKLDTLSTDVEALTINMSTLTTDVEALTINVNTLTTDVEALTSDVEALTANLGTLTTSVGTFNDKFDNYQKATQWVVQLAFTLIASATVTVIVSTVLR
jgi:outer membrane murein-binding lipoprotein Lpp